MYGLALGYDRAKGFALIARRTAALRNAHHGAASGWKTKDSPVYGK